MIRAECGVSLDEVLLERSGDFVSNPPKDSVAFDRRALDGGWIIERPMQDGRVGESRTGFAGSVANSNYKIHRAADEFGHIFGPMP